MIADDKNQQRSLNPDISLSMSSAILAQAMADVMMDAWEGSGGLADVMMDAWEDPGDLHEKLLRSRPMLGWIRDIQDPRYDVLSSCYDTQKRCYDTEDARYDGVGECYDAKWTTSYKSEGSRGVGLGEFWTILRVGGAEILYRPPRKTPDSPISVFFDVKSREKIVFTTLKRDEDSGTGFLRRCGSRRPESCACWFAWTLLYTRARREASSIRSSVESALLRLSQQLTRMICPTQQGKRIWIVVN